VVDKVFYSPIAHSTGAWVTWLHAGNDVITQASVR